MVSAVIYSGVALVLIPLGVWGISRYKVSSRGGSHAADWRGWEPALLQNFHLLSIVDYLWTFLFRDAKTE